jgi:hypothetical protein
MKKLLVVGLISSFVSAGAFAACSATAATPGTNTADAVVGSATAPTANTEVCVCNGGGAARIKVNGGSGVVIPSGATVFLKNGFDVQCSNKTVVSYNEVSSNVFAVASGSLKGNQSFQGSSAGGAVTTSAKCTDTNDACSGANVSTALTAAVTAAGGSGS